MFLFKKIVGSFFLPFPLCLEILIVGLILLWFTRREKAGKIVVTVGAALLVLLGYGTFTDILLRPLEYRYPALLETQGLPEVRWVVVLGGGHRSDARIPATSQLMNPSLCRLVEGIRLHFSFPGSKLILSGGGLDDPVPEATVMAEAALTLRVGRQNLVLESKSRDTEEEALFIQKIVGKDPFVLVTSASHIPRAMALFQRLGMLPIPAPTDYKLRERQGEGITPGMFFPVLGELQSTQVAMYEYLGAAWAKVRGRI